jgi:cytochrome P450
MLTAQRTAAPVLTFAPGPSGAPPLVLRSGATGDFAYRPVGGDPILVLRRRTDVLQALTDSACFGMAAIGEAGQLRACPLTGAEMQSPDGGLLNMDPPQLRVYRQQMGGVFTRRAAEATRPAVRSLAKGLAQALAARPTADVLAGFAEPFTATAVCSVMGIPHRDWDRVLEFSRVAFAVVPSAAALPRVSAAWQDLYAYYQRARPAGALRLQLTEALRGFTPDQVVHVIGTVSNGFGAVLPVLATALAELAQQPRIVAACLNGERSWESVAEHLLSTRTMFPVALPRIALAGTWLEGRLVTAGTVVLPSLIAAAGDPAGPPRNMAFGAGPHFCPGAALTRVWIAAALAEFFGKFPAAHLAGSLEWQPGTLSVPREIPLALRDL